MASARWSDLPGVLLKDVRRYARAVHQNARLASGDPGWIGLCNRIEQLEENSQGPGVRCLWTWGSDLHAPGVLPMLGRWLQQAALRDWEIGFAEPPAGAPANPQISFIVAHGGDDRMAQLQTVLRTIFAQRESSLECIVVDQSPRPIAAQLPGCVRTMWLDTSRLPPGWRKSWAFNVGAKMARGGILVFHDGDVCAPREYAAELLRTFREQRCAAASLQRFLFYLSKAETGPVLEGQGLPARGTPERIYQNWKGGTIAVRRDAFFALGGFDEGFVDWGGEDDEFFDRCGAAAHHRFGYLPFVHLWHPPQQGRHGADNPNIKRVLPERLQMSREARIAELTARRFGRPERPDPEIGYKDQEDAPRRTSSVPDRKASAVS